jgi:hypothetical protein
VQQRKKRNAVHPGKSGRKLEGAASNAPMPTPLVAPENVQLADLN